MMPFTTLHEPMLGTKPCLWTSDNANGVQQCKDSHCCRPRVILPACIGRVEHIQATWLGKATAVRQGRQGALQVAGLPTTHITYCSCCESAAQLCCADLPKTGALGPLLDALKQEAVKLQAAAAHVLGVAAANNPTFQAALLEQDATTVPTLLEVSCQC